MNKFYFIALITIVISLSSVISLKKKLNQNVQITKGCFSPKNGVFQGASWQYNGGYLNGNILEFTAYGNDIYVGFFDSITNPSFTYAFIIGGWSNTQTHLYKGNSFSTQIASAVTSINPLQLNTYLIVFDSVNETINLYINAVLIISFYDSNFQNVNNYRYSQYSSNVQICPANCVVNPVICFSPQNGVFQGGPWQNNGNAFNGALVFQASGNDIYVGFFNNSNLSSFIYAFIIAGWGNSATHLYKGNSFGTPVASVPNTLNLSQVNNFVILFNSGTFTLELYINSNLILSYYDSSYSGSNVNWVQYSQYSSNVIICNSHQVANPWYCSISNPQTTSVSSVGQNDSIAPQTINCGKNTSSEQFYYSGKDLSLCGCPCCQRDIN